MSSRVRKVSNDAAFKSELTSAGTKLVVVDFHATWCGPCKAIAPLYEQFSNMHHNVVFLKVDVEVCKATAEEYNITAMPTFLFIKSSQVLGQFKGADPKQLKTTFDHFNKQAAAAGEGSSSSEEEVAGHSDLKQFILPSLCNCLNESDEHAHKNVFEDTAAYLESDCDEQLMLTTGFNQSVKVHSLKIRAPTDGSAPKTIKLFVNQPNEVDFDSGERMEGVQKLELEESDVTGEKLIPLRFVKFQNVTNIVVFVVDNQAGDEITKVEYIKFIGSPCNATNMGDFKRVSGKAGESHMG